jgi:hypothetical protein
MGQIRGNINFLKPDQRANGYVGGRSEGKKLHMGQIRGNINFLKPDQRVMAMWGPDQASFEGVKSVTGNNIGKIDLLWADQREF